MPSSRSSWAASARSWTLLSCWPVKSKVQISHRAAVLKTACTIIDGRWTYVAMFLLDELQKRRHVRSAEMVHRFQSGKHAHFAQSLEMVFTNVLNTQRTNFRRTVFTEYNIYNNTSRIRTNMVVRKSNLWKNWVMNICISRTLVTSFFSTSRRTSMNHSKCLCDGHIHIKYTFKTQRKIPRDTELNRGT